MPTRMRICSSTHDVHLENLPLFDGVSNIIECQFPESCIICLEDLSLDSKVRLLPCGHVFHYPCIDDWFRIRDVRCPICGETFYHLCTPKERKPTRPRETRQSSSQSNSQNNEPGHTKLHALKLWCRKMVNSQTQVPSRPRRASISQEL